MRPWISGCRARSVALPISTPSKLIEPSLGSYRPTISRATVDLPQPDSPTRLKVSPLLIEKFTPSTARTMLLPLRSSTRLSQGAETSKIRFRLVTVSIGTVTLDMGRLLLHQPAGGMAVAGRHRLG